MKEKYSMLIKEKNQTVMKDSGQRELFSSGAVREPSLGKGRYDLIPGYSLARLAVHFENGAKKYSERNWEKGLPLSRFIDSAHRHLNQFTTGDREEDHLAAIAWNVFAYMFIENEIQKGTLPDSFDNVPWPSSSKKQKTKM